jgi:arylformamidase
MFIELGYELHEKMPVFPGSPEDRVVPHSRMSRGGEANTTFIHHYLHNGTHVDAPFHFWDGGLTIDQLPIENFVYERPLLIEKQLGKGELFTLPDIQNHSTELESCDILLLESGYWKKREDKERYCDNFPALSEEAARFLRTNFPDLKALAIDTLSIENPLQGPQKDFVVHKTLLSGDLYDTRPLLIYEDVNLGKIVGKRIKRIYAFPLRWKGLDASPVNLVAET